MSALIFLFLRTSSFVDDCAHFVFGSNAFQRMIFAISRSRCAVSAMCQSRNLRINYTNEYSRLTDCAQTFFFWLWLLRSCVCKASKVKPCTTRSENCNDDDDGGGWERIFKLRTFLRAARMQFLHQWEHEKSNAFALPWWNGWEVGERTANGKCMNFMGRYFHIEMRVNSIFNFVKIFMRKLDDLQTHCQRTASDETMTNTIVANAISTWPNLIHSNQLNGSPCVCAFAHRAKNPEQMRTRTMTKWLHKSCRLRPAATQIFF